MKLLTLAALSVSFAFPQATTQTTGTITSTFSATARENVAGALAAIQLDVTYPDTLPDDQSYPLPVTVGNDAVALVRNFPNRQAGPEAYAAAVAKGLMEKYPIITGVTVSIVYTQTTYVVAQRITRALPPAQQAQVSEALATARRARQ